MGDLNVIQIILVLIIAFLAGMDGILDEFQFHQPLVACTLIGLATGNLKECVMLGGSLQLIALGWANIGAAVAPDAAFASVASAIIFIKDGAKESGIGTAIAIAVPLAMAGLVLTIAARTLAVFISHAMDSAAAKGSLHMIDFWQYVGIAMQGLRIAIPAGLLLAIKASIIEKWLGMIPQTLTDGLAIGGGLVVAVGYAMVINMMANKEVWPFFAIGFAIAAVTDLTLMAIGVIGVALALIYLNLSNKAAASTGGGAVATGDPLGDILDDY